MRVADAVLIAGEVIRFDLRRGGLSGGRVHAHTVGFRANIDAVLLLRDLVHQRQHLLVAVERGVAVFIDVVHAGSLRQPGQERRLRQGQPVGGGVEIGFRPGLDTIRQAAVVVLVQIQLQNIFLAEAARNFRRQHNFARFALQGDLVLFIRQQQRAGKLLGNCRRAGHHPAPGVVLPQSADQRHRVIAGVVPEFLILGGDGGGDQIGRNAVQRHPRTPAGVGIEDFVQHVAVAVEDARGLKLRGTVAQIVDRRKGGGNAEILVHAKRADAQDHQRQHEQQRHQPAQETTHAALAVAVFAALRASRGRYRRGRGRVHRLHRRGRGRLVGAPGPRARARRAIGRRGHARCVAVHLFHALGQWLAGLGVMGTRMRRRDFYRLSGDIIVRLGRDRHCGVARRIFRLRRHLSLAVPTPGRFRLAGGMAVDQRVGDCSNRRRLRRAFFGFAQSMRRLFVFGGRLAAHIHGAGIFVRSVETHRTGIFQI